MQAFDPEKVDIPLEKYLPKESLRGLEVEVIEFTINNVEEFLEVIHPRTFPVIFITLSVKSNK